MDRFSAVSGVAAPLPIINVDTDKIIPKQYLTVVTRTGLGRGLFHELRYDTAGAEIASFILNREPYRRAKILVSDSNFGCGSSREHAPWALLDFGIRCVIAPSFADIFANNSAKNGMLLITLPQANVTSLLAEVADPANAALTVDLPTQTIVKSSGESLRFAIAPELKERLLMGLDDISITLHDLPRIEAFERQRQVEMPWL
jgi:3-isopropylmalate/(R)-2-methylmalate dehydratase small subunit